LIPQERGLERQEPPLGERSSRAGFRACLPERLGTHGQRSGRGEVAGGADGVLSAGQGVAEEALPERLFMRTELRRTVGERGQLDRPVGPVRGGILAAVRESLGDRPSLELRRPVDEESGLRVAQ